jgi:hypothetical protein
VQNWTKRRIAQLFTVLFVVMAVTLLVRPVKSVNSALYRDIVLTRDGKPAGGATIRICQDGATGTPCTPPASIYTDRDMTTLIPNGTLTASALGNYSFYAPAGWYLRQITYGGVTTTELIQLGGTDVAAVVSVKSFGCKGDGITDDTSCMQAALSYFSDTGSGARAGQLVCPAGRYIIKSQLTYTGDLGHGFVFSGEGGLRSSPNAPCNLQYAGPVTANPVLKIFRGNGVEVSHIAIWAADLAAIGIFVDSDNDTGGTVSSDVEFVNVSISNFVGVNSAGIKVGHGTNQVDNVHCTQCYIVGSDLGTSTYGFWGAGTANTKLFTFKAGSIGGVNYGWYANSLAASYIGGGTNFGNIHTVIIHGGSGQLNIDAVSIENVNYAALVVETGFDTYLSMRGSYWAGVAPADDFIMSLGGPAVLEANHFTNIRVPSVSLSKIKTQSGGTWSTNGGGLVSLGNRYVNSAAGAFAPLYTNTGAAVFDVGTGAMYNITSIGDQGGVDGSNPEALKSFGVVSTWVMGERDPGATSFLIGPTTGNLRLTKAATAYFRNNANGGNIKLFSLDASDIVNLGDTTGIKLIGPIVTNNSALVTNLNADLVDGKHANDMTQTTTTPVVNTAACIKTVGPPVVIGYCSTALAGGPPPTCTCN